MRWKELHEQSTVVDLHNHAVLKKFLLNRNLSGQTKWIANWFKRAFWPFSERSNFPLLMQGGIDVVLSTCYVPEVEWLDDQPLAKLALKLSPQTRKRVFDPSYFKATVSMMDTIEAEVVSFNKVSYADTRISFARNGRELNDIVNKKNIAMIHSVEGAHSLQGDDSGKKYIDLNPDTKIVEQDVLQNLEYLASRGVAYLTLAHFYRNVAVSPVFPYPTYGIKKSNWKSLMSRWDMNEGLSAIGIKIVERMIELGVLIDIAHCTPKARAQIYEIVGDRNHCLLASHTGAFEINRDPYNLEDWELKWFAEHECVIGIIFMNYWLSPIDTPLGLKYIEQTIDHISNVAGSDIIGLGTDFDGFTDPPDEIVDMSQVPRLTRYLHCFMDGIGSRKYKDEEIKNILGGNALRLLTNGWGAS